MDMDKELMQRIIRFRDERDWKQFHTGENLAKSIAIESGELLEVYQWGHEEKSVDKVKEELADVLIYAYLMAEHYGLDAEEIMREKIEKNEAKYPVFKAKGNAKKYSDFDK